jgi:hypothetical protein
MNFLSSIREGQSGDGPTPPQSPPPATSQSISSSGKPKSPSKDANEVTVRLKPYSGLEVKTLWNHFNKEDLIHMNELAELLDRILVKDATDIYTVIRGSKGWKDYCTSAMRMLDTSKGNTIDLQEFAARFNDMYLARFYYVVKHLLPYLFRELKKICQACDLDPERMSEVEAILVGDVPAPQVRPSVDAATKEDLVKLKALADTLAKSLEQNKAEHDVARQEISRLTESLLKSQKEYKDLLVKYENEQGDKIRGQEEFDRMKQEVEELRSLRRSGEDDKRELQRLKDQLQSLREDLEKANDENRRLKDENRAQKTKLGSEVDSLRVKLASSDADANRWRESSERFEKECSSMRGNQSKLVDEWKSKFEEIIQENERCRTVMSEMRSEIVRVNSTILEAQLKNKESDENNKISTVYATALSGVALDPLRTELVNQFGSIDAVVGKRKRITLHELETIALSMGYSREYCRKLFYALDIKNKGFLSGEQFRRPLPLLHKELCLLTQSPIEVNPKRTN